MVARFDEEGAAVLQLADTVGCCLARLFGYEGTVLVVVHIALPRLELEEAVGDDGLAVGGGEERVAQANDAARGNGEVKLHAVTLGIDGAHLAFAAGDDVDDLGAELLGHQHRELLNRFAFLTIYLPDNHLGLTHLQLVALAAHGLDEDAEVQDAAPINEQGIGRGSLFHTQGQVFLQLFEEAVAQVAAGDEFAFLAEERRVVDGEEHAHRGFIHLDGGQWLRVLVVADGVANLEHDVLVQIEQHGAYLAGLYHVLGALLAQTLEGVELFHTGGNLALVAFDKNDGLARLQGAAIEASDGDTSQIAAVVERRKHHLRVAFGYARSGDVLDNQIHEVGDVVGGGVPVGAHPALFGRTVGGGEIQLVVVGSQIEHEVEYSLLCQLGVAVGFINLVDDHDGFQTQLDGLLQHEACLRHGTFEGIHHQQHAVGHVEHTLHLAAEVAVAGGVDDVNLVALVADRDVFGQDGDAALALEVVVVEDEFAGFLIFSEKLCLVQHAVNQSGLSMVNMRNNGNISNVLHRIK